MPTFNIPTLANLPKPRSTSSKRRRVVIVVIPGPPPMEYIGPMAMFAEANFMLEHSGRPDLGYDVEMVTPSPGTTYEIGGMKIVVDRAYNKLRGSVDTLMFAPIDYTDACLEDKRFINWAARMADRVRRVATICIGSYILAQAGVLNGRRATTHWCAFDDFASRYPDVELDRDAIYVKDGHVYTSAGASSGFDLTLSLIEEDFGQELALRCAQGMVMYLKRPGGQSQFSVHVAKRFPEENRISSLQAYIAENVAEELSVESLAERVAMSPRNFARVFTKQVGLPPGRFVERSRLETARFWLEQTDMAVTEVANRCGYGTADGMRIAFDRQLGVGPREYRRRFGHQG